MHDLGDLLYLGDRENSIKLTTSGLYLNSNLLDDSVRYAKFNLATRLNSINKDEMFIYVNGNNLYVNNYSNAGDTIPLYDYAVVEGKSYRPNSINNTFWAGSTDGWTHLNGSWTTSGTGLPGKESIGNHLVLDSVNEIYGKPSTTIANTSLFSSSEIIRPQIGWCTGNLNVLNNVEIISL